MPKKPRQAHIPPQAIKHRRARRPFMQGATSSEGLATAAGPTVDSFNSGSPAAAAATPTPVRQRRRLEAVRGPTEVTTVYRANPGQLPTFDRHYLMRELFQIGWMSGLLLGVIIFLAIVLR